LDITIKELEKSYSDFKLGSFDFSIKEGEYFVLLGPSGSGKTKTIEFIAGLDKPDSGKIIGMEGKMSGFIYQEYMLFPHMNVYENISYGLRMKGESKSVIDEKVNSISEELGVQHLLKRGVKGLSGGEKQRVAIARAMIISPDVYIFDEPTSSLDRNLRSRAQNLFRLLHRRTGKTFIHVTHDFEEALSLGERIGVIFNGKIVQIGSPDELYGNPASGMVADFIGYRNVYVGRIKDHLFSHNGIDVVVPLKESEKAYIAIRPDDVILSGTEFRSSARNSFKGVVKSVIRKVSSAEVVLDIGIMISVEITRRSLLDLNVCEGKKFCVTFKVSSVKVFER